MEEGGERKKERERIHIREKRGEKEGGEEFADGAGFQVFLHEALSREGTRLRLSFFRSELSLSHTCLRSHPRTLSHTLSNRCHSDQKRGDLLSFFTSKSSISFYSENLPN